MLVFTQAGRRQCVTSYRPIINISTVSYQYCSYFFYCKIYLLRFICCYYTTIYIIYHILLRIICNNDRTFLLSQISNQFLSDIFKHNSCWRQINPQPTKILDHPHTENNERQIPIRFQMIVVKDISTWI